jgi:4-amino-4-deoxy-L-arabinose transferase-like glycosyltransferase
VKAKSGMTLASRTAGYLRTHPGPWLAVAVASAVVVWFCGLEIRALFSPDEGRYADIAREMLQSGDWVTPRLNGLKYFEKPPLQYWATAVAFAVFGADEWTARLWPAFTGFLGLLFAAFAGARLAPGAPPLRTAAMFAGCWAYFLGAQFLTLDMGLTFFLTAAMLAFLLSRRPGLPQGAERGWMLVAWAAMALAVLSKGLVGVLLPALALLAYVVIERDWKLLGRLHWGPGLLLFAVLAAPWFVLVQQRNPEFFRFFFIREHFERFLLPNHHRPGPWWYFVPVLLVGLLPWTFGLPAALIRGWRAGADGALRVDRFLVVWAAVITVFFSVSESKLPGYVLPAFPALLLLLARNAPPEGTRHAPATACVLAGAALAALAAAVVFPATTPWPLAIPAAYAVWLLAAGAALCAAGLTALRLRRRAPAVAVAGLGSLLALQLALSGIHVIDGNFSSERLIDPLAGEGKAFPRDPPFYSVAMFDHSVPFYLGRPVTLVAHKNELAAGIATEPAKYVDSVDEFLRRWNGDVEAFAIMTPALYEKLRGQGLPSRVVVRDDLRVIIARH